MQLRNFALTVPSDSKWASQPERVINAQLSRHTVFREASQLFVRQKGAASNDRVHSRKITLLSRVSCFCRNVCWYQPTVLQTRATGEQAYIGTKG